MSNKLPLTNGMEAIFDDVLRAYTANIPYHGYELKVTLAEYEENPDTIDALKYTFEKFYKDIEKWDLEAMDALCNKVVPILNKYPEEENVTPEEIRRDFALKAVAILDDDRVTVVKPVGVQVELTYMDKNPDPDDIDEPMTLSAAGTLEEGFEDFYLNDAKISGKHLMDPHELSNGDVIEYSPLMEIYSGEVDILNDNVECFFEMDEDELGAENAFELFEKVYKKADVFDKMARKAIFQNIEPYMQEIRDTLADFELTIDEIMEDMFPDSIVFGNHSDLDFSYMFLGSDADLKMTVTGSYNLGFTRFIIEYLDENEDEEY